MLQALDGLARVLQVRSLNQSTVQQQAVAVCISSALLLYANCVDTMNAFPLHSDMCWSLKFMLWN